MAFNKEKQAIVILAAGLGKRMKSGKAKVLHEILGKPMIMYVVETANRIAGNNVVLVIGNQADKVREMVSESAEVIFALQKDQLGTGHAVSCALPYLPDNTQEVVVLCGDVPLLTFETVMRLIKDHVKAKRDISLLAVEIDNPKGYGRVLFDKNRNVSGIVEEADASAEQKRIKTINTGIYCIKKEFLFDSLQKVRSDNVQGEFYLTDIVKIGYREGKVVGVIIGGDCDETIGVNNRHDLMTVENIMRNRLRNIS
jgi:UDP-N-acetylglucosamine diphosphorylase/glucosamine-1-phosphate N-acetyltransferase